MNSFNQELFVAARGNNRQEVRRLASVGADVNAKNDYGSTTRGGRLPVVKALLSGGADIFAANNRGR
jgi:hypothetical protein